MKPATDELIPTRATLLHRLKDWGDQSSWEDFFATYEKLIFGVALKAGLSQHEAQEVVQETMISVAKKMPAFKYDPAVGSFKSWLLTTTRWRIADQIRQREPLGAPHAVTDPETSLDTATHPPADSGLSVRAVWAQPETGDSSLDALWDAEWEKNLFAAALQKVRRQVDPQKYQVFDFYVNRNWPPEKVATTFGIPVSQVYLAKHRVTEMLAEEVRKLELKEGLAARGGFDPENPVNPFPRL
jgi:RNA polymerase sigma-70 factor (ECF subfamily)